MVASNPANGLRRRTSKKRLWVAKTLIGFIISNLRASHFSKSTRESDSFSLQGNTNACHDGAHNLCLHQLRERALAHQVHQHVV